MFVLDTNVISEISRAAPETSVIAWFDSVPRSSLFVPSVVAAELLAGVERLPPGRKRSTLSDFIFNFIDQIPSTNRLPFGMDEAVRYAVLVTARQKMGREIGVIDAQIAAIAGVVGLPVVTRNVKDFEHCGIEIINPWMPA